MLDDLGKAAFSPSWGALMAHVSSFDRRRRARVMSYVEMGEDAAGVVAPIVAGALAGWRGFTAMLLARAALAVAAELYAVSIMHRRPSHAARWGRASRTAVVQSPAVVQPHAVRSQTAVRAHAAVRSRAAREPVVPSSQAGPPRHLQPSAWRARRIGLASRS